MFNWLRQMFKPPKIQTERFALSEKQIDFLQQMYFVMDFEREQLEEVAPELLLKWQQFIEIDGNGWSWFPQKRVLADNDLKQLVENYSMRFEVANNVTIGENDKYFYRLLGPAIIAENGAVVCRGVVEIVIDKDEDEGAFLKALGQL